MLKLLVNKIKADSTKDEFLHRLAADDVLRDAYELKIDRDFKYGAGGRDIMIRNIYLDEEKLYLPKGTIFHQIFYSRPQPRCLVTIIEKARE